MAIDEPCVLIPTHDNAHQQRGDCSFELTTFAALDHFVNEPRVMELAHETKEPVHAATDKRLAGPTGIAVRAVAEDAVLAAAE